jgi:peptide/nickel transport system substrate-binding protein
MNISHLRLPLFTALSLALLGPFLLLTSGVHAQAQAQAESTFRIALNAAPPTKGNPFFTTGITPTLFWTAIYDRLTDIDENGDVVPEIAISWEPVSETEWHFKLRPNVVFSNGEKLTAQGVKTVFDIAREDPVNALYWFRERVRYPRVEVIDDLTIAIHTSEPNILTPAYLSALPIAPPGHVQANGIAGLINEPIGSGPFVVDRWDSDKVTLSANKTSWRAPRVDRMEAYFVPDSTARLQALETGQVDVAVAISTDQIDMLELNGHRAVMRNPTRVLVFALKSNDPKSPFSDVRVRQAFNYAVNKEAITAVLLAGLVKPASQPALPLSVGYDPAIDPYPYDPDKARALLAEAGYADGLSFVIESPSGTLPNDTAILQQIAADVSTAGMTMEVRLITYPQLLRRTTLGDLGGDGFLMDFTNRFADALKPMLITNHACTGPGPWFCDEEIQPVIDRAERTFDLVERTRLTRQVVRHYHDVAQSLFLFPIAGLDAVHKRVTTWQPRNDRFMYHLIEVAD